MHRPGGRQGRLEPGPVRPGGRGLGLRCVREQPQVQAFEARRVPGEHAGADARHHAFAASEQGRHATLERQLVEPQRERGAVRDVPNRQERRAVGQRHADRFQRVVAGGARGETRHCGGQAGTREERGQRVAAGHLGHRHRANAGQASGDAAGVHAHRRVELVDLRRSGGGAVAGAREHAPRFGEHVEAVADEAGVHPRVGGDPCDERLAIGWQAVEDRLHGADHRGAPESRGAVRQHDLQLLGGVQEHARARTGPQDRRGRQGLRWISHDLPPPAVRARRGASRRRTRSVPA